MVHAAVRSGLRVAVDAGPLFDVGGTNAPTGVGRYVGELIRALEATGVQVVEYAVSWSGIDRREVKRWRAPASMVRTVWRLMGRPRIDGLVGDVDLVHATNFVLPPTRLPGVVTIHDLSFLRSDTFPGGRALRRLVPWSIQRARRVFVPTNAIRAELCAWAGISEERVTVTHEGVSPLFFGATPLSDESLRALGITRPFALAVGTIEPRKNLARLVEAWRAVSANLGDWTLVIVGPRGWGPELPRTTNVVLPGYLGDETLPGIVAAASLFCYPSLYEGFGLPPLEAMAAGVPVIAGANPATSEVLGDYALLIEPRDVEALAEAIVSLVQDDRRRAELARGGRVKAAEYSWARTAAETIAGYAVALGS